MKASGAGSFQVAAASDGRLTPAPSECLDPMQQERMHGWPPYGPWSAPAQPGTAVEVEIFGDWIAGSVSEEPLFDPKGERVRA